MKNRWMAALAATTVLAVSLAWAQEPVFRVEIRGVQTLLDEVQAAGRGTTLESTVPFVRPMLMRAVGVDFFALLQGDATFALTLYADPELVDRLAEGGDPEAVEALLEEIGESAVVVASAVPRDPAAFWRALEKAYPGSALSGLGRDFREFRINGAREPAIYGADVAGGSVALCFGSSQRWTFRTLRSVLADAEAGTDRSLPVPGTLALGVPDFKPVQAFYSGVLAGMAAEGTELPPGFRVEDAFLWKSGAIGISVKDDVLRFHVDGVCSDSPLARALSEGMRLAPPAGASPANAVNRPGALLAGIGYMNSELMDVILRMQCDAFRNAMPNYDFDDGDAEQVRAVFERVAADMMAAAGRIGDGAQGIVAMPHRGERGLPALAVYVENIRGGAEVRSAVARAAELGPLAWLARYAGELAADLDSDDLPVVLRKGDGRELPGAAVDAYVLELADDPENEFVTEAGFELPFELGTVEFAWLDSGALVVSTLAPADLDALVADAVVGAAAPIAATPCWNGLVEVPGDGKLVSCDYIRFADIARELVDLAAEWCVAFGEEDFRKDEWFARFWDTLPDDPMTLACRGWLGDDGHLRQETAFNLAPLREWGTRLVAAGIRGLGLFEPGCAANEDDWE